MVRKSSSTLSPFLIALRRHHHPRQLSSSPQLRHSFFFVRHEASSHHAAASSSIVFDPNKTVEPPSCHLRHRFNQSTPDRLPSSSRPTITGLLTIYVIQRHHLHFYATGDHSPRLCAELCITINTNLQIYSICTLMGRVLCVLRLLGRQGPPRGVSSRGTYYWGAYLSSCCSLLPMLLPSCHFYTFSGSCIFYFPSCCFIIILIIFSFSTCVYAHFTKWLYYALSLSLKLAALAFGCTSLFYSTCADH